MHITNIRILLDLSHFSLLRIFHMLFSIQFAERYHPVHECSPSRNEINHNHERLNKAEY